MMQAKNQCFLLSEIKRTSGATILSSSHQALGGKEDSETPQTLQEVGGKVHDGNQRQKVEEKKSLFREQCRSCISRKINESWFWCQLCLMDSN